MTNVTCIWPDDPETRDMSLEYAIEHLVMTKYITITNVIVLSWIKYNDQQVASKALIIGTSS